MSLPTFPQPVPAPTKRSRKKKIALIGGGAFALLLIGGAAAGGDESKVTTETRTEAVEETTTVPEPVETTTTEAPVQTFVVTSVVDGDTVDLDNGERVRLVGIDAPEVGTCGADEATVALSTLVLGQAVTLEESDEDRDQYNRLLRYVVVNGVDAGGQLLSQGLAIPRYNSTDGYGLHPRETEYAGLAQPLMTCAPPTLRRRRRRRPRRPHRRLSPPALRPLLPRPGAQRPLLELLRSSRCGCRPVHRGEPGYGSHLDRDGDGVGCES